MAKTKARQAREAAHVTPAEATLGPVAGALVGYATFGILVTVLGAVAAAWDGEIRIPADDWQDLGFGAGILAGVLLFLGYLYGGFVAGRMAGGGRMGMPQGLFVFVAGVAIAAVAGVAVSAWADGDQADRMVETLRVFGLPGSSEEWSQVGTVAGIASLAGMLVGSLVGGRLAEYKLRKVQ